MSRDSRSSIFFFSLRGRRGLRLGKARARLLPARLRLQPGRLQGGELLLHARRPVQSVLGRAAHGPLLGLGRGERLRRDHDRTAALLDPKLGLCDPRVQGFALGPKLVVLALVLGQRLAGFAQVDFALDDAVGVLLRVLSLVSVLLLAETSRKDLGEPIS